MDLAKPEIFFGEWALQIPPGSWRLSQGRQVSFLMPQEAPSAHREVIHADSATHAKYAGTTNISVDE